jgi:hypothetical protein
MSTKPIWSWRQAIEEMNLKAATKALGFVIANDLMDTGKFSQMPVEELARRAGMNVRSAETHNLKLKKAKLLDVKIRWAALGHPIGRKFSPMFPDSFALPQEAAQTANFAGIYKETSSQTLPKTSSHTARAIC